MSQKDSDGDGVNDNIDECPETPDRESVDVRIIPIAKRTVIVMGYGR